MNMKNIKNRVASQGFFLIFSQIICSLSSVLEFFRSSHRSLECLITSDFFFQKLFMIYLRCQICEVSTLVFVVFVVVVLSELRYLFSFEQIITWEQLYSSAICVEHKTRIYAHKFHQQRLEFRA